jgi:glycosyltransferase involved in cell wall biosynthesis
MNAVRVGVVCDLREEQWYSMDLVADMLLEYLPKVSGGAIRPERLCPAIQPMWTRMPLFGLTHTARLLDRLTGRLWAYPRWLAPKAGDFDLFHIVDHSYAHLVRVIPASRTIVSCHDLDAIRAAVPRSRERFRPSAVLAASILEALALAARVVCLTEATRQDLLAIRACAPDRVSVIPPGVHPSCSPNRDDDADERATQLLGPAAPDGTELLHVGSTIPRKRIGDLLAVVSQLRRQIPGVRLIRVGGEFTRAQRALVRRLGLGQVITTLPFVERPVLAALYRRSSLVLLPSDREGFGLPVVEAMACGTPVVASDLPALREAGGTAVTYRPVGAVPRWVECVRRLLEEKMTDPEQWDARRRACIARAASFSWTAYASGIAGVYSDLAAGVVRPSGSAQ